MTNYKGILKYAMQMELDGYNFFKEKAHNLSNPTAKKLFLDLADIEMDHYNFLKEQLKIYEETNSFDKIEESVRIREKDIFIEREESEHIKSTLEQSDIPDLTILRMAYLIERDYAEFYRNAKENSEDPKAKEVFKKLEEWELSHEELFKKEYDRRMKEYINLPWGG